MNGNLGSIDRLIRIVLGFGIVSLAFYGPQSPWAWFGLLLVASAAVKWCPIYHFIGIRTCIPVQYTWKH
ncbi:MAG: DUF2892 domain-containing protein [Gammaproteobacteria bacterium]|nr:DUF2892 domain-containing protein [Gammaproteobacteria bacterium]MDH5694486.1 DUF2892 domain-containing protein [Gammaproteobacteria bacterium]